VGSEMCIRDSHYTDGSEAGTIGDAVIFSFSQDKVVDAVSGGALILKDLHIPNQAAITLPLGTRLQIRLYPLLTCKIRLLYPSGLGKILHAVYKRLNLLPRPVDPTATTSWQQMDALAAKTTLAEFQDLAELDSHRRNIAKIYAESLPNNLSINLEGSANLRFPVLVKDQKKAITALKTIGAHVSDTWYDAPIAPKKYMHLTDYAGQCPNAEKVATSLINLPTHINVSPEEAEQIASIIKPHVI
jgi:perosamine synthetase